MPDKMNAKRIGPKTNIINGAQIKENKKFIKKWIKKLYKRCKKIVEYNECREIQYLVPFNKINFLFYALDQNKSKLIKRHKRLKFKMFLLKSKKRGFRFIKKIFKKK